MFGLEIFRRHPHPALKRTSEVRSFGITSIKATFQPTYYFEIKVSGHGPFQ